MALSRGMTALRAALGAVGGGLEGYAQFQEMERKREFEREKEKAAAARQAMLDAAALRGEERQAAAAGMIPATQYTGLSPFDMPGATPRQPLLRQTIGGREMVLPEAPKMAEHRAGVAKAIGERKEKAQESAALRSALANVEIGGKRVGEEQAAALELLSPNERTIILGAMRDAARPQRPVGTKGGGRGLTPTALAKIAQEEAAAEAIFNTPMAADSPMRQALTSAFNAMRENNPDATPQELMRAAVAATKSMKLPVEKPAPARGRGVGGGGGRAPTNPPPIPGAAATPTMPNQPPAVDPLRKFYDRGQR